MMTLAHPFKRSNLTALNGTMRITPNDSISLIYVGSTFTTEALGGLVWTKHYVAPSPPAPPSTPPSPPPNNNAIISSIKIATLVSLMSSAIIGFII